MINIDFCKKIDADWTIIIYELYWKVYSDKYNKVWCAQVELGSNSDAWLPLHWILLKVFIAIFNPKQIHPMQKITCYQVIFEPEKREEAENQRISMFNVIYLPVEDEKIQPNGEPKKKVKKR